jgi:hypothetical protein
MTGPGWLAGGPEIAEAAVTRAGTAENYPCW